ncbi:MAG: phage tail protein [Dehalococcoidia bacterium]|nr:phage tail protein [Dehalococcoidia bacterium]
MPHNRRTFLRTAGLATAVASTAPLSLYLHEGPGFAPSRAGAAPGGFAAGKFALELDGKAAGFLPAVQGGNVVADVDEFILGTDGILQKELGDVHYEEITMLVGLGMDTAFWDWVGHMVDRDPIPMDGAILFADMDSNVVRRMEFKKAWLSEVSLPALDAASNEAGLLTIKFRPESTALKPPGGKLPNLALAKQKTWLASNFRIQVGDLPCTRVTKIEALTIKQQITEYREGGDAGPVRLLPGKLEFPNLVVTFSAMDAGPWQAFFDGFVLAGNNGQTAELAGNLGLMAPDLKNVLATLEFFHLGIFRLAPEEVEPSSTNIQRFRADLYCEGNRLFVGGLTRA